MSMLPQLSEEQANQVWDLLVEIGGAREDEHWRQMFIRHATEGLMEFRFVGHLGFGGKIHGRGSRPRIFVDCYYDEHTPERDQIITEINQKLREMGLP